MFICVALRFDSTYRYMERKGIDIGPVDILVYAQVLQGKRYVPCNNYCEIL